MADYKAYFAIEKSLKRKGFTETREDYIRKFTAGKKNGLSQLSAWEYKELIKWLKSVFQNNEAKVAADKYNTPENKMRRKIISLLKHKMNYTMADIDKWCMKYSAQHKTLQQHTLDELPTLVTQAENLYKSFLKGIK